MAESGRQFWIIELAGREPRAAWGTAEYVQGWIEQQAAAGGKRTPNIDEAADTYLIHEYPSLDCSCCGGEAKFGDMDGMFWDGDASECGCVGNVTVTPGEDAYFNLYGHEECPITADCRWEERPST